MPRGECISKSAMSHVIVFQHLKAFTGALTASVKLSLVTLAVINGYLLVAIIWGSLAPDGVLTEGQERVLFVTGFSVCVLLAVVVALLLERIRQRTGASDDDFYGTLIPVQCAVVTAYTILCSRAVSFPSPVLTLTLLIAANGLGMLGAHIVARRQLCGRLRRQSRFIESVWTIVIASLVSVSLLQPPSQAVWMTAGLILLASLILDYQKVIVFSVVAVLADVGFIALMEPWKPVFPLLTGLAMIALEHPWLRQSGTDKAKTFRVSGWVVHAAAALLLLLTIPQVDFIADRHHYNFYLGPVNDLLHGKTLLVDANTQYGLLVIMALSMVFRVVPVGYEQLSLLVSMLVVVQFLLVYVIMRSLIRSPIWSLAGLLALVTYFWASSTQIHFPSVGPLRFLPVYILVTVYVLRLTAPHVGWRSALRVGEWILLGICALWSIELLLMAAVAYTASRTLEAYVHASSGAEFARQTVAIGLSVAICVIVPYVAYMLLVQITRGVMPRWDLYLGYFFYYGQRGWFDFSLWTPWIFVAAAYFSSLTIILISILRLDRLRLRELLPAAVLTFSGIMQMLYYLTNPTLLASIAVLPIPLVIYWLSRLNKVDYAQRPARLFAGVGAAMLFINIIVGINMTDSLRYSFIGLLTRQSEQRQNGEDGGTTGVRSQMRRDYERNLDRASYTGFQLPPSSFNQGRPIPGRLYFPDYLADAAIRLIRTHAAPDERVALFMAPESSTHALLYSNRVHVYPLSHPALESYNLVATENAITFEAPLTDGDLLFVDRNFYVNSTTFLLETPLEVQSRILERLCQHFTLEVIEVTPVGISVLRLHEDQDHLECSDFFGSMIVQLDTVSIEPESQVLARGEFGYDPITQRPAVFAGAPSFFTQTLLLPETPGLIQFEVSAFVDPAQNYTLEEQTGDGVVFRIMVTGEDGESLSESRHVQPGEVMPVYVDISRFVGQQIRLAYTTEAGASADRDWALWLAPTIRAFQTG